MGGSIFVGVRSRDGVEHLGISWTNWLPRLFADPTFYEEGDAYRELMDYWDNEDGRGEKRKKIAPSEYGAVLVDLQRPTGRKAAMWNCNHYSNFGEYLYTIGGTNEPKCDELAERLLRDARLRADVRRGFFDGDGTDGVDPRLSDAEIAEYLRAVEKFRRGDTKRLDLLRLGQGALFDAIRIYVGGVDVTRVRDDDLARAKKMNAWLGRRNWRSPSVSVWRRS